MRTESLKKVGQWVQFGLGLLLGVALAFLIYAGLQPRLQQAVHDQQTLKAEAHKRDSLASVVAAAKAKATLKGPQQPPQPADSLAASHTLRTSSKQLAAVRKQLTVLAPGSLSKPAFGHRPGLAAGLALVVMALAMGAGVAAWRQAQQEPPPPGAITSPVLEALFTLPTHRHLLQEELSLSPRQIKRFSSKARVQHSQLRAFLKTPNGHSPGAFSLSYQLKAFQLLLLLEANRQLPHPFPTEDEAAFISQLQLAYHDHPQLAQARQEAFQHPVIRQAQSREMAVAAPTPEEEARFMQQFYEMNAGLLA